MTPAMQKTGSQCVVILYFAVLHPGYEARRTANPVSLRSLDATQRNPGNTVQERAANGHASA